MKKLVLAALLPKLILGWAVPMDPAEQERFLREAPVVAQETLSRGVTKSKRVRLSDGSFTHDAHLQRVEVERSGSPAPGRRDSAFKDSWKFNIAAYRLAKLLGIPLVPASVERRDRGAPVAMTWWVDDVAMDEGTRRKKNVAPPDSIDWTMQIELMRIFDQLIANPDRNMGNILITNDWQLRLIDHTRAFQVTGNLLNADILNRIDRRLLRTLQDLDKSTLDRELRPYLKGPELEAVLDRRNEIVKIFEERRKKLGDKAVLFDFDGMRAGADATQKQN